MTARVEASAFLQDGEVGRAPAVHPHHVGLLGEAVVHVATSPSSTGTPLTTIGMASKSATRAGAEFMETVVLGAPMRAVPAGMMTFEACSAVTTSAGERPLAASPDRAHADAGTCRRRGPPWQAGDGEQPQAHEVGPVVEDLLLGHGLAAGGELRHRQLRGVGLDDVRGHGARRQDPQRRCRSAAVIWAMAPPRHVGVEVDLTSPMPGSDWTRCGRCR